MVSVHQPHSRDSHAGLAIKSTLSKEKSKYFYPIFLVYHKNRIFEYVESKASHTAAAAAICPLRE